MARVAAAVVVAAVVLLQRHPLIPELQVRDAGLAPCGAAPPWFSPRPCAVPAADRARARLVETTAFAQWQCCTLH